MNNTTLINMLGNNLEKMRDIIKFEFEGCGLVNYCDATMCADKAIEEFKRWKKNNTEVEKKCVKCGSTNISIEFKEEYYLNEYLLCTCNQCKYKWRQNTLDSEKKVKKN